MLAEKIESWEKSLPVNVRLAYLPTLSQVKIAVNQHWPFNR